MKTGKGSLNPYATSYVPLSKRAVVGESEGNKPEESKFGNEAAWPSQPDMYSLPSVDTSKSGDSPKLKGHPGYGCYGSSSQQAYELSEKQIADEEYDMDMAFLQMTYPGISDESLSDVYMVNNSDLESTVDMLNQLELHTDFTEKLPDTLDIGDISEPASSIAVASPKLKKVGEAGPSSSGSS